MSLRWLLIAHTVPGFESEFEHFSRFLSIKRPKDSVVIVGLPLLQKSRALLRRGRVINGVMPPPIRRWVLRPPLHAAFEVALPTFLRADILIGFDPIAVLHGRRSHPQATALWGIDFVPTRNRKSLDSVYRRLERRAMRLVDLQIENTQEALSARQHASGIVPKQSLVVPITIDTTIFPKNSRSTAGLRLAFLGSLNKRTGADRLLPIVEGLQSRGVVHSLDIIGTGPLLEEIRSQVVARGLGDVVTVHGFVESERGIAQLLATCNVGLAPFAGERGDFTWFADPQKIKFYLAAGLHVVTTDVVPIASLIRERGAGSLLEVHSSADRWSSHLASLALDANGLAVSQAIARDFAEVFERSVTYEHALRQILELLQ